MGRLQYILKGAMGHVRQSPVPVILSVITLSISFLILDSILLFFLNFKGVTKKWDKSFVIVAYLKSDATDEDGKKAFEIINSMESVQKTEFVNREDALKKFGQEFGENSYLLEGLEENPLPAYFIITPELDRDNMGKLDQMIENIKKIDAIDDIQYEKDVVLKFIRAISGINILFSTLGIFILIAVLFIVSNTIRLSLFSRKDEIEIMTLVGASDAFISAPYILEAVFQCFTGAVFSFIMLYLLYIYVFFPVTDSMLFIFGIHGFRFYNIEEILYITGICIAAGLAGSYMSLRRFLRA
ncbi:MAG TPA: permease-like cell division protein FtsX [bacterium]